MNVKSKLECVRSSSGENLNDKLERPKTGLGERIERARGDKTQIEMAAEMGISRNTLSRYESETRLPDAEWLQRFCKINHVSADWLLFGDNPPKSSTSLQIMDIDSLGKALRLVQDIAPNLPFDRKMDVTMTVYALFLSRENRLDEMTIRQVVESLVK